MIRHPGRREKKRSGKESLYTCVIFALPGRGQQRPFYEKVDPKSVHTPRSGPNIKKDFKKTRPKKRHAPNLRLSH